MVLSASLTCIAWSEGQTAGLAAANAALQEGNADKALAILQSLSQPASTSAESHNLRCRVLLTVENWDGAGSECEQAVSLEGQNSDYHLWFGRTLGERAERASFVTAFSLAKRTRAEFELSVQLNPRNAEALADLGEFYNSAPGVVGGGTDKAEGVASQLDNVDPARAAQLRAVIAEGHKDYVTAENRFRQAIAVSAHPSFQWMSLASFYRRRERWTEMESAVESGANAAEHDKHAGVALFNGASVLIKSNRNPALAAGLLETYVSGNSKTEEAPALVAHVWLARLYAQRGDTAGARREREAALSLASGYKPAEDLKN
jgi:Flp pilus assembly protein TadD